MRAALLCCQWETDRSRGGDDFWCSGRTTTVRYMSVVSTENFCVWEMRELMAADGGYLWRSMWILWMTSLSSHSTSASVSELSRLVTHTDVSSPKCNSEKRDLSNSVMFWTLFKWHRYCSIKKMYIIRKINTGIRYEPVYRPVLLNPLRIQRTAGGTPSGDRVKSSETKTKKKKKVEHVIYPRKAEILVISTM